MKGGYFEWSSVGREVVGGAEAAGAASGGGGSRVAGN
jgi:hypothetical protein